MAAGLLAEFHGKFLSPGEDVQLFVARKRELVDRLSNANETIPAKKLVACILNAVRGQFEAVVESVEAKITTLDIEELDLRLQNAQEARKQTNQENKEHAKTVTTPQNVCTDCGKTGHRTEQCWHTHPEKKPSWFRQLADLNKKRNRRKKSILMTIQALKVILTIVGLRTQRALNI